MFLYLFVISSIISSAQVKLWITDYDQAKEISMIKNEEFWAQLKMKQ